MITGLAHVNLTVTPGTLAQAEGFYGQTLGLSPTPVPELQRGRIAWYITITSLNRNCHVEASGF